MNKRVLACALMGTSLAVTASAKVQNEEYAKARKEMAQLIAVEAAAATATTGDADSFGRYVKFAGVMTTGGIYLAQDCTPDPSAPFGPEDHCFVANPAPATTTFTVNDAARVLIPAKTANSLICHWQTPSVVYFYNNPTANYLGNARFQVSMSYTIENAAFNSPTQINPVTGLPFGGSITVSIPGVRHSRGLQAGEFQIERDSSSRTCIDGLVSKRALVETYGFTAAQATNFFKNDTIISLNLVGTATLVDSATMLVGTRFVAD